ncbi:MAG: ATP-binding protein [Bacteroidetes bacterium]|nr:ATP-binding protein [Rhodothermia bacterium]MCS7155210.1 ATP-binding protein [Bacteroidota bacterium]MCX7907795.1 ATP-binding protein [Bacteroidota bacterium]MDW8138614.1 ATP-binding protein [Bacteroidota bacterium]MDW8284800.1 ATP-binding protein [Bacteroidota bacterium]
MDPLSPSPHRLWYLELPSSYEALGRVEGLLEEIRRVVALSDSRYFDLVVAVTEAVTNAIEHAHAGQRALPIYLEARWGEGQLVVSVQDQGPGFDVEALPDPTDPENLMRPGGRGVFLMRALMDEVRFLDRGRRVELVLRTG